MSDRVTVKDDAYHDTNKPDTSKLSSQFSSNELRLIGELMERSAKVAPGILPHVQLVPQSDSPGSTGSKQQPAPADFPPAGPVDRCPAKTAPQHLEPRDPEDRYYPREAPRQPQEPNRGGDPGYWQPERVDPLGKKPDFPKITPM